MTTKNIITPEAFREAWCKAWSKEWNARDDSKKREVTKMFSSRESTPWTEYMLTNPDSFLVRVGKQLNFDKPQGRISQEDGGYYRLDMALITDDNKGYPFSINVAIEHENEKHVENEMWKLVHIRSPLKVIVFYDHKPEKLKEKLKELLNMLQDANAAFSENQDTTYLFIIGNLTGDHEEDYEIRWRWSSDKQSSLRDLC